MTTLIDVEKEINKVNFFQSISRFYNMRTVQFVLRCSFNATQNELNLLIVLSFYFWKSTFFIYDECSRLKRMYAEGSV